MYLLRNRQQSILVGLLCLMFVIGRVAFDLSLPALPAIQHYFLTSQHKLQLGLSLFLLGFGISQLFYGPLSDQFGRRPILLVGLGFFISGSVLASYATSIDQLIIARFVMGLGIGVGVVIARASSRDLFDGKALARITSIQTLVLTFALFVAPIIGGYLLHYFSWRADFIFLVVLGLICFTIFFLLLPETNTTRRRVTLLEIFQNYIKLLMNWKFIKNAFILSFSFSGLVIYFQLTPFIFEKQYGLSPINYSWLSLLIAFAYLVGTISVNLLLKKKSLSQIILYGSITMLLSGMIMIIMIVLHHTSLSEILFSSMFYICGFRLIFPSATANCLSPFKQYAGTAAALLGAIVMAISGLVSFLCTLVAINPSFLLGFGYLILALGVFLLVFKNVVFNLQFSANQSKR